MVDGQTGEPQKTAPTEPTAPADQADQADQVDTQEFLRERAGQSGQPGGFDFNSQMQGGESAAPQEPVAPEAGGAQEGSDPTGPEVSASPPEITPEPREAKAEPPDGGGTDPPAGGVKPADNGDGEPGAKPGDAAGDLPAGVKKRLNRQRKQSERRISRLQTESSQKDRQIQELQAKVSAQPQEPIAPTDPPATPAADPDEPSGPYPVREHYASDDAWLTDVENWEEGRPQAVLPPGQTPAEPAAQPAVDPDVEPAPPAASPPASGLTGEQQTRLDLVSDLTEAMDDWEEAPEALATDFFGMVRQGHVHVTDQMLDQMSNNDAGAKVAAVFLEKPRDSRRIARMPASQQKQAMDRLLADAEQAGPPADAPTGGENTNGNPSSAPDIRPLRGEGNAPSVTLDKAESTEEYLAIRRGMKDKDQPFSFV